MQNSLRKSQNVNVYEMSVTLIHSQIRHVEISRLRSKRLTWMESSCFGTCLQRLMKTVLIRYDKERTLGYFGGIESAIYYKDVICSVY